MIVEVVRGREPAPSPTLAAFKGETGFASWVVCGACGVTETVGLMPQTKFVSLIRHRGWKSAKGIGWACADCVETLGGYAWR